MNDNQNNYVRPGRTTSRVLAPSGGQSSLTFGLRPIPKAAPEVAAVVVVVAADETPVVNVNEATTLANPDVVPTIVSEESTNAESSVTLDNNVPDNSATSATTTATTATTATTTPSKKMFTSALLPSQQQELDAKISQNAFVSGSNMNGGCVMTGRPSSRVLAPPGGHTSIKLG